MTFIRTRYRQNQYLWSHFGDKMSPENCGVFQVSERGDFWRNFGILQLRKMGLFWGHLCTLSEPDGLTYGSVAKPLTLKLIQYTKVQIF